MSPEPSARSATGNLAPMLTCSRLPEPGIAAARDQGGRFKQAIMKQRTTESQAGVFSGVEVQVEAHAIG